MSLKTRAIPGGDLLTYKQIAVKAGVSETLVKNLLRWGYVEYIMIEGYTLIFYRDFLRGMWEYEKGKQKTGRKPKNGN